jgi:hypothetical protein
LINIFRQSTEKKVGYNNLEISTTYSKEDSAISNFNLYFPGNKREGYEQPGRPYMQQPGPYDYMQQPMMQGGPPRGGYYYETHQPEGVPSDVYSQPGYGGYPPQQYHYYNPYPSYPPVQYQQPYTPYMPQYGNFNFNILERPPQYSQPPQDMYGGGGYYPQSYPNQQPYPYYYDRPSYNQPNTANPNTRK